MKLLLNFLETHSVNYAFTSGILLTVLLVVIILLIVVALRLNEAKNRLKNEEFYSDVSAQTMADYDHRINVQECTIEEKKKAFEDAVAEITELRNENKHLNSDLVKLYTENAKQDEHNGLLIDEINDLKSNRTYWKERALHQKHSKPFKQVESEWYECETDTLLPHFERLKTYQIGTKMNIVSLFSLFDINGKECIVEKKYFKPVVK